jgi:hypothetical protein
MALANALSIHLYSDSHTLLYRHGKAIASLKSSLEIEL